MPKEHDLIEVVLIGQAGLPFQQGNPSQIT